MRSDADLQWPLLFIVKAEFGNHRLHRVAPARDDDVRRPVDGRDGGHITHARHNLGYCIRHAWLGRKECHHAPLCACQRVHQPPAFSNQRETVGMRHHPGHNGGGIFTRAVTRHGGRRDAPALPERTESHLQRAERRLRIAHLAEQRFTLRTEEDGVQRLVEQRRKQRGALIEAGMEDGLCRVEGAPHARVMRALACEEKDHTGRRLSVAWI